MTNSTDAKPLSAAELAEIRQRAEKATPPPWESHTWDPMERPHVVKPPDTEARWECRGQHDLPKRTEDADFIAASRDDIPRLLATIDSLTARSSEITDEADIAERLKSCYWAAHAVQPRTSRGEFWIVMAEKFTATRSREP